MSAARPGRTLLIVATGVVALALGAGLWTIGAPGAQRDLRLDERRQQDIARLDSAIREYRKENGALPPDLGVLASRPGVRIAVADPVSGEPYGYTVTSDRSFRLCATFVTDSSKASTNRFLDKRFPHGIGPTCFDLKAGARAEDAAATDS
ncbi:hypothetical protein [Arenimonas sp.]|uniref:hypothetical protein n=1 Tax=Arenimonas sp. TaxID=1872635 RepID=UPI0025B8A3D0|nr:hypothetical protein [Arenimonas sp.]